MIIKLAAQAQTLVRVFKPLVKAAPNYEKMVGEAIATSKLAPSTKLLGNGAISAVKAF